jgi:hypothetical protein
MTLNINLEDVPWLILDLVKARILRNRMKLLDRMEQQEPPQTLKPLNQYPSIGARSSWRRDEPAATLDPENRTQEVVIWYPNTAPALGFRTPAAADVPGVFRAESDIFNNEIVTQYYNIENNEGSNVLRFDEGGNISWEFEVPGFRVGAGNFTLEFYSRIEGGPGSDPDGWSGALAVYLLDEGVPSFGFLSPGGTYIGLSQGRNLPPESSAEFYTASVQEVNESNEQIRGYETNLASSAVSSDDYSHVSLQRIDGTLYGHFRGQPMSLTLGNPDSPVANYGTDRLRVFVGFTNSGIAGPGNGDTTIFSGQVRVTNRGRYGTGTYTPPSDPFYDPTP